MQKCTRTQNKNNVERFLPEKTKRQHKTKKNKFSKGGKEKATRKHRETKKKTSGFRKNKSKNIKRQKRHSKKENVETVFWEGNSEERKKKEVSK